MASRRYVDDLIIMSHRYCRACLEAFVRLVYPVHFDVAPESPVLKLLDVAIDVVSQRVDMAVEAYDAPPAWAASVSAFHGYMMGRAARWRELELDQGQLARQAATLVVDMRACGWKPAAFRQVYYALGGRESTDVIVVLRAALRQMFHPT